MGREKPSKKSSKKDKHDKDKRPVPEAGFPQSTSGYQMAVFGDGGGHTKSTSAPHANLKSKAHPTVNNTQQATHTTGIIGNDIFSQSPDASMEAEENNFGPLFPDKAGEVAQEVQVISGDVYDTLGLDASRDDQLSPFRPGRDRSRSPLSSNSRSPSPAGRYLRTRRSHPSRETACSTSEGLAHKFDQNLYQDFLNYQSFIRAREARNACTSSRPQALATHPEDTCDSPSRPINPFQLHAPSHTGYSDDEERDFDTRSITSITPEDHKLSSEFRVLMDNIHFTLGDDLPPRNVSLSRVKAISQLDDLEEERKPTAFPHSSLIASTFDCLHQQMWGDANLKVDDPNSLPHSLVGGKKLGKRRIPKYREKFYSAKTDPLQPSPADVGVSMESYSTVKESMIKIKAEEVKGIERQARKSLLSINAIDVLLGAIRKIDSYENPSEIQLEAKSKFFSSLVLAVKHAAEFSATSVALSMNARRKAFLEATPESLLPPAAKNWLLNQPFLQPSGDKHSLFGDVVPQLNKFTAKHNKLHGVTKKDASSQKQKLYSRPSVLSSAYHTQPRQGTMYTSGKGSRPYSRGRPRGGFQSRHPSTSMHSASISAGQATRGVQPPAKKFS